MNTTPNQQDVLSNLLQEDRKYHPQNGGEIANHCPMTLIALRGLSASDLVLSRFNKSYSPSRYALRSTEPSCEVTKQSWQNYLGNRKKFVDFRHLFESEISSDSSKVLAEYLPVLLPGLAKGLFHPIIRLAFALRHGDNGGIADALSYFCIRHEPLYRGATTSFQIDDRSKQRSIFSSPKEAQRKLLGIWTSLRNNPTYQRFARSGGSTFRKVFDLCEAEMFRDDCCSDLSFCSLDQDSYLPLLKAICLCAIHLYHEYPSLTTLHAVTGVEALATVLEHLKGPLLISEILYSIRFYWLWLSALFVEKGMPSFETIDEEREDSAEEIETRWQNIIETGRESYHVHVIKMLFSCWVLWQKDPSMIFLIAAEKMVKRNEPW